MSERPGEGLRERKKARTRALIQREALRLFQERGYADTTVEQIAEAAEVAPSTVFRYFPTKEDLVLMDHFPPFAEALAAAPRELGPVAAVREALRVTVTAQAGQAAALERERLMLTVPELWAASLENVTTAVRTMQQILADRAGRDHFDPQVRNAAGAIVGVVMAIWFDWVRNPGIDGPAEIDRALLHLEGGLLL
ncbi:TetR family transcriptional regulator [Spongiactinospora sp. TRM90649]|uniref:TetR/AcrR family transcriptional regulator n=1 Tax=Spongiactinospora sp. TRM90649 TaxID=3031114 RepID=UPI0023F7CBFF|nr:TetR family transcriptional regulator [Spongiactinospora sp. TRM90649]MDF5752738.1 TetR family transcriptional regulator [Spongiactinospora sp. TRM90649]